MAFFRNIHILRISRHKRGSVLIVTLSLMILLALLAVGSLTLSSVALRNSSSMKAQAEARANARLGMMLALGELQQELGPDRRVSANSGILDLSPDTPDTDGLGDSPRMLGVWESWGGWLNGEFQNSKGDRMTIQDTYKRGRGEALFRKWLVSHADPARVGALETPEGSGFGFGADNSVLMVSGRRSSGSAAAEPETRAGLLPIGRSGRLAWWIGSENQKAAMHAPLIERDTKERIRAGIDSLSHMDPRGMDGLANLKLDERHTSRYVTNASAELGAGGGDARDAVGTRFHDVTVFSKSLLADVRDGGLKKDLSLLFEKETLPRPYRKEATLEPGVRPWSRDLLAFNQKLARRTLFSWSGMHNYYRTYRNQPNPIPNQTLRGIFKPSVQLKGETASVTMYLNKNKKNAVGTFNDAAYVRMPVMLKHYANIGLQTVKVSSAPEVFRYYIDFAPVTVLWNPYNVRLEIPNDFLGQTTLFYKNLPLEYKVWVNGQALTGWKAFNYNRADDTLGGDLQTHFTTSGVSTGPPLVFDPGEMLVFSHAQDSSNKWKNAKFQLGYQPQNFDSRRLLIPELASMTGRPRVALSLRFSDRLGDNASGAGANNTSFAVRYTTVKGTLGSNQVTEGTGEVTDADVHLPAWLGLDWFQEGQQNTVIVPDSAQGAAPFQYSDSEPYAIASIGIAAKCAAQPDYVAGMGWQQDWRGKNWLTASPAFLGTQLFNPTDRNRAECPYWVHFTELNGGVDISSVCPHSGKNGILGSGVAGAEQISFAPVLEIPTRPINSLAGFAGARLLPGWWDESSLSSESSLPASDLTWTIKRMSYHSGVPGVGIGNSFAHPMVDARRVYTYQDVSRCDNRSFTEAYSDYWDHLLLANDALWDSWFLSSAATRSSPSPSRQIDRFFKLEEKLEDGRLEPWSASGTQPMSGTDALSEDGWKRISAHMVENGGFNVNSTSADAWKALLHGLIGRPFVYQKQDGSLATLTPGTDQAVLSRFHLPTTDKECANPRVGVVEPGSGLSRWSGVRFISRDQLDRLAEECVRQVKLRGPFLNMSDFINRRLSNDDLGARGALQAAIDYDDGSPDPGSINHRFKGRADMIPLSRASGLGYPFPQAAAGSRFTAIPGYVVQSDLLQAFGNSLTVRDDTFRIRAYGASRDAAGRVVARAWCEAVVQRCPEYLDPANPPERSQVARDTAGNITSTQNLSPLNLRFGRAFRVVQVRWLDSGDL